MRTRKIILGLICLIFIFMVVGCKDSNNKYKDDNLWVFKELDKNCEYDTFFLAPAATTGSEDVPFLDFNNEKHMSKFAGAVKMNKGIYDENTRFFAPYYQEALLYVYTLDIDDREEYLKKSYEDVKEAFEYYLDNYNNGNKIIIAGFSEGADMALRLLKDFIDDDRFYDNYIACYAIGNLVSDEYLNSNERLVFASGEKDQKVIISFNCESPDATTSFLIGENIKTNSINPLTWSRDFGVADKSLNKGAVFLDTYGEVTNTIDNFTGCYIDPVRGTLKVTDVEKEDYNSMKDLMGDGVYHLYDYQFFYNNLKENVSKRIEG